MGVVAVAGWWCPVRHGVVWEDGEGRRVMVVVMVVAEWAGDAWARERDRVEVDGLERVCLVVLVLVLVVHAHRTQAVLVLWTRVRRAGRQ